MSNSIRTAIIILSLALVVCVGICAVPSEAQEGGNQVSMGDKEYATFEEAFSVAIDGDEPQTIKLLTDVETSSSFHMLIPADKKVTFDLNGHTLDYSVWDYQEGYIHNLGTLNITDSSTDKVEDSGHFNSMTFQSMGTINIYNGHFNGGNSDG